MASAQINDGIEQLDSLLHQPGHRVVVRKRR